MALWRSPALVLWQVSISRAEQATSLLGNLLIVVGVCCALYTVVTRRMVANSSPLLIVTLQQTAALLWALLIWPVELWGARASLISILLDF